MRQIILLLYLLLPFQVALNLAASFDIALVRVAVPALVMAWFIRGFVRRSIIFPANASTPLLCSFLFLSALSLIEATHLDWGLRKLLFLVSLLPFFVVVADVFREMQAKVRLIQAIVLGAFALALVALLQFLLQFLLPLHTLFTLWTSVLLPPFLGASFAQSVASYPSVFVNIGGHTLMRAVAVFPDPHMLSFYLGMSLPLALGLAFTTSSHRRFFFVASCVILLADLLSFSRGGYLALLAATLWALAAHRKQLAASLPALTIPRKTLLLAALLIILVLITQSPVGSRLSSSFSLTEGSNQGRLAMWSAAAHLTHTHPLLGIGLGNYASAIKPTASYRDPIYAHNLFLDIAAETGILNALIFLALLIISWRRIGHQSQTLPQKNLLWWASLSLIVFGTHALVETPLYSVHILPLLIALLAL